MTSPANEPSSAAMSQRELFEIADRVLPGVRRFVATEHDARDLEQTLRGLDAACRAFTWSSRDPGAMHCCTFATRQCKIALLACYLTWINIYPGTWLVFFFKRSRLYRNARNIRAPK